MRRAAVVALAAGTLALVAVLSSCSDEPRSHIFAGRKLEDARGCLDDTTSVDVVDGAEPPSTCAPRCIVSPPDFDSGLTSVFVSTMCAPYPPAPFDTSGADPRCPQAIAAYTANVTCLDDGGISGALPDAAAPADAAADAAAAASD